MDNKLTLAVKELAYKLGADLVGVANIERFENAPIRMSPQGILPSAKSVIVCAVHHPDAAIELDGEIHPQVLGPYRIQYIMNDKLDVLSFRIARMLDDLGFATVPITERKRSVPPNAAISVGTSASNIAIATHTTKNLDLKKFIYSSEPFLFFLSFLIFFSPFLSLDLTFSG